MKHRSLLLLLVALFAAHVPFLAHSQSGSADLPSIASNHLFLSNRTSGEVVFYLESNGTARTEHRLPPNSGATYTGAPGDSWFNIDVYSKDTQVTYGLDTGTRHYFEWNSAGVLDVYKMPPR